MTDFTPLITVVIPVYNAASYLRNCLDSVCGQSYAHLQIICVNDGSTDASADILREYAERDARIMVVTQSNAGQAAARNAALRLASGAYIASVDSDDYLEPDTYGKVVDCLSEFPGVDMVWYGTWIECEQDEQLKRSQESFCRVEKRGVHALPVHRLHTLSGAMWNKVVRAELFERYQLRYPEGLVFEDACLFGMLAAVTEKVYFLPDKLYHYVLRSDSTMGAARSVSSRSKDALRIVRPLCEFYQRVGLTEKKNALLQSFFVRAWGLYSSLMPAEFHAMVAREAHRVAMEAGLPQNSPLVRRLQRMGGASSARHFNIGLVSYSRRWNGSELRLLGLKVWQEKLTPVGRTVKSLFYSEKAGKIQWSMLGIPLVVREERDFEVVYRIMGVKVRRNLAFL